MLKRQLEQMTADPAAIDKMAYMDIIRSGAEAGLIKNVSRFREYREKRKIAEQSYEPITAEQIVLVLNDFCEDIRYLLSELEQRNKISD